MRIARPVGWLRRIAIVVALTATGGVGLALPGQAATAPRWDNAGAMITARSQFAVVALPDHSVLAVGGSSTTAVSAEVWRPSTRKWTAGAPLRVGHGGGTSAVLLADGRVLVAGGCSGGHCPSVTADAEIYNPATLAWTTAGPTIVPRVLTQPSIVAGKTVASISNKVIAAIKTDRHWARQGHGPGLGLDE